ncbi:STPG2 protein, partial [Acromyrmex insinuator]
MAFDRTERFVEIATSTSVRVGPGTYDISLDPSKPARDLDNAYPFLSGASRQTLGIPKDVHKFPGPGSYNIEALRKRIPERAFSLFMLYLQFFRIGIRADIRYCLRFNNLQGGISLDYTDVRFKKKVCEGPSPTQYTLPEDLFKETPRKIRSHPGTWRGPAGKLWLIPPSRPLPTGLAVPSKRDVGGYDYNERGVLVKNPVIEHKPTDFYDIPRGETNFTTLKYKGNFWSRMKGRDDERTSVTPGPGDYEHETKKSPAQIHDERIREAKRATSKQPRFLEALYQQKLRQNFPAPNHYDLPKSVFDKYKRILCKCDPLIESPPFNQSTKRFEETFQSDTPGPGTYEITVPQICYGSILHAPFGFFDDRFKRIEEVLPGPADYHTNIGTLAFESAKRFKNKYKKMSDYIKFCKTLPSISDTDEYVVMEEDQVMKKVDEEKYPVHHAVFKSRVDRFPKLRKRNSDCDEVPDSGAYEVFSAFKANRDRCDFLCRRLAPPFGTRASRLPMIPEDDFHVPGPAHYDLRGDISKNVKNGVIYSAPREKKMDIKGPGPSRYHIHPYIASSILKKSFNVTLGQPKTIQRINEVQTPWQRRQSKKILRWFALSHEKYQHCKREFIWDYATYVNPVIIQRNAMAADTYHKYKKDTQSATNLKARITIGSIKIFAHLQTKMFKMSLSWVRILLHGFRNFVNEDAIRHYNNVINEIITNDVTLVKCWVTINEVNLMAYADRNMRTATINQFGITDYHCGYHALLVYAKVCNVYNENFDQLQNTYLIKNFEKYFPKIFSRLIYFTNNKILLVNLQFFTIYAKAFCD